jgi:hypothetical protein
MRSTTFIDSIGPRAQAISECRLVDVSPAGFAAGFRCSVAITSQVWHAIRTIPERYQKRECFRSRLESVLNQARYAVREKGTIADEILILADLHTDTGDSQVFVVRMETGDDGRTAVTIAAGDEP